MKLIADRDLRPRESFPSGPWGGAGGSVSPSLWGRYAEAGLSASPAVAAEGARSRGTDSPAGERIRRGAPRQETRCAVRNHLCGKEPGLR